MTKGNSVPDYVAIGFDKIDRDLRFLIECLGDVLEELGLGASCRAICRGSAREGAKTGCRRKCPRNWVWSTPLRFNC